MRTIWFRPFGWTYRPTAWQGFVIVGLGLLFCVQVFMAVDRHSHSVSDTLYGVFPFIVPTFLLLNWIASKTSKGGDQPQAGPSSLSPPQ
jgi:hypothetical protein